MDIAWYTWFCPGWLPLRHCIGGRRDDSACCAIGGLLGNTYLEFELRDTRLPIEWQCRGYDGTGRRRFSGECEPVRRSTLEIDLEFPDGSKESCFALNEVVVARGSSGRVIDFGLEINGVDIAKMRGDGVLVSTATGSTAYALSAGGHRRPGS